MIRSADRISLPAGVVLRRDSLEDQALGGASYRVSPAASQALALLAEGRTVAQAADAAAGELAIPREQALAELRRLVLDLQSAWLVNVETRRSCRSLLSAFGARRRHDLHGSRPAEIALRVASVLLRTQWAAWLLIAALIAAIAASLPETLLPALLLGAGTLLAAVVHETGHALAARRWASGCFLVSAPGGGVSVVHAAGPHDDLIAASGPAAATAMGLLILVSISAVNPALGVLAAAPFVFHAVGLTVAFSDGRRLVSRPGRVT